MNMILIVTNDATSFSRIILLMSEAVHYACYFIFIYTPYGPSTIGTDTIIRSEGEIPEIFSDLTGNRTAPKAKTEISEAAKKIHRILRRNPNTGPAELASKAGVSRRYASHVKSQFLATLSAE
jgi:hypothetical protein